ncbi:hypothetical protein FRC09_000596 [Ceratobasidium sp. 395]|nr:hypothetical protein FRC09_000596 [Ceratobasidium sp. 395]
MLNHPTCTSPLSPLPADNVQYPTLNNYSIQFNQSKTSIFNQMAANIAALKVQREYPGKLSKSAANGSTDMVTSHIRYLCRCYKSELKDNTDELQAIHLKRTSANSRAHTLFKSQLKIIDWFPNELGKHQVLIVHLGVEGTSSDKEEPGPLKQRSYWVKQRVALSSKVKKLKNQLDTAYHLWYKGWGSRGSPTHLRRPSEKTSSQPFTIEGLPITCISHTWYQSLSKPEQELYQFVPHDYNFSFPEELLKCPNTGMEMEPESSEGEYSTDEDDDKDEDSKSKDSKDGNDGQGNEDEDMGGENEGNEGADAASGLHTQNI